MTGGRHDSAAARAPVLYRAQFGEAPDIVVRAPGRVNLIGEHTDYNDGFVLPAALDRELVIALAPIGAPGVELHAEAFPDPLRLRLDKLGPPIHGWGAYVQGTAWALQDQGHKLSGWQGVVASDIPVGAGLSSSAAIELAAARAFSAASGLAWDPAATALLCRRVENEWVGVASGIMDQMVCAMGRAGHALLLDCRTLEHELVPFPTGVMLAVLDTGTRRQLVESAFNTRRDECKAAARMLGVRTLRDLDAQALPMASEHKTLLRRARHVVTENARTLAAADAMRAGDVVGLGRLMDESHNSLRDDFAVSSPALDAVVEIARDTPGCHGARLTGAGFAGCAVALIEPGAAEQLLGALSHRYRLRAGHEASVHFCVPADGAGLLCTNPQTRIDSRLC